MAHSCLAPLEPASCHTSQRTTATEIVAVLERLLAGEAFLARRSWNEIWWGQMHLDLASGWQLQIAIERDQLGVLQWAQSPDGRDWLYGCQRDDWTLGPDSRIVEPVALLTPDQQRALEALLRQAICWPPPTLPVGLLLPLLTPRDHRRRQAHRPTRAGQRRGSNLIRCDTGLRPN